MCQKISTISIIKKTANCNLGWCGDFVKNANNKKLEALKNSYWSLDVTKPIIIELF
jgi:hypothetical protein